jgi:hypothetical protein
MRSITPGILITALASLSLAGACKSSEKKSDRSQPTTTAGAGETGSATDGTRPALPPVPHRLRSTQPEAAATGEDDGAARPAPSLGGGETDEERMQRRTEMRERFAEARKKYDADGDGQLGPDERAAMRDGMMDMRIKLVDKDGDGNISRDEAAGEPGRRRLVRDFDAADANSDGAVSPAELEAHIAERRANRTDEGGRRRRPE